MAFAGVTMHLEPDSVVLRGPAGRVARSVLEERLARIAFSDLASVVWWPPKSRAN